MISKQRKKTSPVWIHFDEIIGIPNMAKYNICGMEVSGALRLKVRQNLAQPH